SLPPGPPLSPALFRSPQPQFRTILRSASGKSLRKFGSAIEDRPVAKSSFGAADKPRGDSPLGGASGLQKRRRAAMGLPCASITLRPALRLPSPSASARRADDA